MTDEKHSINAWDVCIWIIIIVVPVICGFVCVPCLLGVFYVSSFLMMREKRFAFAMALSLGLFFTLEWKTIQKLFVVYDDVKKLGED